MTTTTTDSTDRAYERERITDLCTALYRISLAGARAKLRLTAAEARLILDACNGLWLTEEILGQHLRAEVQDAIRLNGHDEKWGVDGKSLVARLRELPLPLTAAVEIWIAEFWAGDYNDDAFEAAHLARLVEAP